MHDEVIALQPSEYGASNVGRFTFYRRYLQSSNRGIAYVQATTEVKISTFIEKFFKGLEPVHQMRDTWWHILLYGLLDGTDVLIQHADSNNYNIYIAAQTYEQAGALANQFQAALPPIEPEANSVPISFWVQNAKREPEERVRTIEVPSWDEVHTNYPRLVQTKLEPLLARTDIGSGGKLILWHGAPGTGKTHGIRCLAREWSKWCRIEYIVDPEKFFGDAHYLVDVITAKDTSLWRLLIVEDADEFLVADAKRRSGQALSRLLNLADGLVGQGLKMVTLITTNEPLVNIHPAVARKGRCIANIAFDPFSREEASMWLSERRCKDIATGEMTIADLYEAERKEYIFKDVAVVDVGAYL